MTKPWHIEVDGQVIHYGSRETALAGAIRYARMRPGVEVIVRNGSREYTRAREGR